ncbi:hypothetical protein [Xenorhabdus koppenhoeferi]|uniref:Uncharacterized protein n=1 Tax=Xenorhabdus koppenhoeferi TaxID=351659 RepID=A0A1I7HG76_9GAMM|nr:hypothetical protein [Xenorhabdus koppenhoeferi]SFU59703.1 hypothetical protein SAMN05421784_11420 [Xenorhabdus koppenhoeferi]
MNQFSKEPINLSSLILNVETPFLSVPSFSSTYPKNIYTKVSTIVRDIYGKPLVGSKIFVSTRLDDTWEQVIVYESNNNTEINITSENGEKGFFITSAPGGNIVFFIHPNKSRGLVFKLFAKVLGTQEEIPANHDIYIVNKTLDELIEKYPEPTIPNLSEINLKSDGKSKFQVNVNYDNPQPDDSILFFVNDHYSTHAIHIINSRDTNGYFSLPYEIFDVGKLSNFYFVVINRSGDISDYKSRSLTFTYHGNPHNQPWTDVDRIYDACTVYNSGGPSPENIVRQNDWITDATISGNSGKFGQYGEYGLFVKIIGGLDDSTNTSLVPFGSKITLNLYINSQEKKTTKYFKNKQMPIGTNNTAELIIPIPSEYITNNPNGLIYLDYQIGSDNDVNVSYGNIWFAKIDTKSI